MRAITYDRFGGPDVLELTDLPTPKVGPDSVLVRVRASSVNPVDWKVREDYLAEIMDTVFPVVPGWDVAGVVEQVGLDTPEFKVGDEVFGYVRKDVVGGEVAGGTFAELVAAPVRTLARKPSSWSFEEAAAAPLAGLTAIRPFAGPEFRQATRCWSMLPRAASDPSRSRSHALSAHE